MTTPSTRRETLRNGRVLTERQADRRRFMQGLLASGGLATAMMAGPGLLRAGAQATPTASPEASPVAAYDGPLAAEQVLRLAITEPTTLDPGVSYGDDELAIFFNIYDGLAGIDQATGEVVPRVAESWDINEDASVYTFKIREGVTWSDGTPINANDFVYSWQRVLDPDTLSEYMSAMYFLKNGEAISNGEMDLTELGVKAIDDLTLEVTLTGPMTFFPKIAATWTYFPVPKHIIDTDPEGWTELAPGVSNGPYIIESWTHDESMVLVANPNYSTGDPVTITRAEYTIMEDTSTQAYIAFENDELDYAAPEGPDLDRVLADPEASKLLIQFPLSNCFFAVCDTSQEPTNTVEFRQALYKAINRDELANTVLRGQYLPAYTVMSPDIPGSLKDESPIAESPEEAAQLVADAGVDPASVNLELTYINSPARNKTVAEYLQATWQEVLGITVTLAPIEDAAYIDWRASRETQPFGVYTGSWGSDFVDPSNWINQNFTSQADHYRNHWVNAEFDEIAAAAVSNTNEEERVAQYQEAEAILVTEAPIIPLYRGKAVRAVKPYVNDAYFQSTLSVLHLRTVKIAEH
jgi:oligopeptide transport system substrate-binding protein